MYGNPNLNSGPTKRNKVPLYQHYYEPNLNPNVEPDPNPTSRFHVAVSRDILSGDMSHYINGEKVYHIPGYSTVPLELSGVLMIGQEQDGLCDFLDNTASFNGQIDEVRVWPYVRSEEQIADNYLLTVDVEAEAIPPRVYWQLDSGECWRGGIRGKDRGAVKTRGRIEVGTLTPPLTPTPPTPPTLFRTRTLRRRECQAMS